MWREKLTFQYPFECNCGEEHPVSDMFTLQGALFPLRFFFSDLMNLSPGVQIVQNNAYLQPSLLYLFFQSPVCIVHGVFGCFLLLHVLEPSANSLFLTHYPLYSLL